MFHCPSCDGYEAEGCDVVVLGWSADVAGFALELLDWAATVTVLTDGRRFEGDDGHLRSMGAHQVVLVEDEAVALQGHRGNLTSVQLRTGDDLPCQMAFFSLGHQPRTVLGEGIGCKLTAEGCLAVDECGRTSVAGVYAAGDLTRGYQGVQMAAAKGTMAGVTAALSLREEPPLPADLPGPPASPPPSITPDG